MSKSQSRRSYPDPATVLSKLDAVSRGRSHRLWLTLHPYILTAHHSNSVSYFSNAPLARSTGIVRKKQDTLNSTIDSSTVVYTITHPDGREETI